MLKGIVDSDQLGILLDFPVKIRILKDQNLSLVKSNRFLGQALVFLVVVICLYSITKFITNMKNRNAKKN